MDFIIGYFVGAFATFLFLRVACKKTEVRFFHTHNKKLVGVVVSCEDEDKLAKIMRNRTIFQPSEN